MIPFSSKPEVIYRRPNASQMGRKLRKHWRVSPAVPASTACAFQLLPISVKQKITSSFFQQKIHFSFIKPKADWQVDLVGKSLWHLTIQIYKPGLDAQIRWRERTNTTKLTFDLCTPAPHPQNNNVFKTHVLSIVSSPHITCL